MENYGPLYWDGNIYINYLKSFCTRNVPILLPCHLTCLFNYLCISVWTPRFMLCFGLWTNIFYYYTLIITITVTIIFNLYPLFQFCPLGVLSVNFCVPLTYLQSLFWALSYFLVLQDSYSFCPNPRNSHFANKTGFFLLKSGIRTQSLGTRCPHSYGSAIYFRP